jgi:hypothetical protein
MHMETQQVEAPVPGALARRALGPCALICMRHLPGPPEGPGRGGDGHRPDHSDVSRVGLNR